MQILANAAPDTFKTVKKNSDDSKSKVTFYVFFLPVPLPYFFALDFVIHPLALFVFFPAIYLFLLLLDPPDPVLKNWFLL
jgi:hypothetical protein